MSYVMYDVWEKLGIPFEKDVRYSEEAASDALKKMIREACIELNKPETFEDKVNVSSPIDDLASKVKTIFRDVDQKAINTKKAEKAIDSLFGVFKKAIRDVVTEKKPETTPTPLNNMLGKMKNALETAVTDVSRPLKQGLGDRFARKFPELFQALEPEPVREQAIYILNKQGKFSYLRTSYRPTLRAPQDRSFCDTTLREVLYSYHRLSTAHHNDVVEYLIEGFDTSPDKWRPMKAEGDMIAAAIDLNDENLIEFLTEILTDETCEYYITPGIVRGIVMSDNVVLRKYLIDDLLDAGLQEGVRQCICENMDAGTLESQIDIFKAICDHNLIRYSSVRRAFATQTGISEPEGVERLSDKLFALMKTVIFQPECCEELALSTNHLQCHLGLWGLAIRDRQKSAELIERMVYENKREPILAASIHARYYFSDPGRLTHLAKYIIDHYADDHAILTTWFDHFISGYQTLTNRAFLIFDNSVFDEWRVIGRKADPIPLAPHFESKEEAKEYYDKLGKLLEKMPKDGYKYSLGFVYEKWLQPPKVLSRMFLIAWMMQDNELLSELAPRYSEASCYDRECLQMAVWNPVTEVQRHVLFQAALSRNSYYDEIVDLVIPRIKLEDADYEYLKGCFRFKAINAREYLYELFLKAPDNILLKTTQDLLKAKKKEMRMAGLELVKRLKTEESRQAVYNLLLSTVRLMDKLTPEEEIVIQGILDQHNETENILNQPGYGIYDPNITTTMPVVYSDINFIKRLFINWLPHTLAVLRKLDDFIEAHRDLQYEDYCGCEQILGKSFWTVNYDADKKIDRYPFSDLWRKFYDEEIKNFESLLLGLILSALGSGTVKVLKDVFDIDLNRYYSIDEKYKYDSHINQIFECLFELHVKEHSAFLLDLYCCFAGGIMSKPLEMTNAVYKAEDGKIYPLYQTRLFELLTDELVKPFVRPADFRTYYIVAKSLDQFYQDNVMDLSAMEHIRAHLEQLITKDEVYQSLFDLDLGKVLKDIAPFIVELNNPNVMQIPELAATAQEIYWPISELILSIEAKRSELPTAFSDDIYAVPAIRGTKHLVELLTAIGDDIFDREAYYRYHHSNSKRFCLSKLIMVSQPSPGEDENSLKDCLKDIQVSPQRLVDVAMFNPTWAPIIERYLGWEGLTSGVYYFTAHVGELFSDHYHGRAERKKAIFARYTPISYEDLQQGAMALHWFKEAYDKLGEAHFQMLYKSAKYISETNKHTRARKYADAALGKYTIADTENQILDKRNKDLLMAYPLIPLADGDDCLKRYQFIQAFKKAAKNFGSQRRTSETAAAQMAIRNLASNAGYDDETRLILTMETKLSDVHAWAFEWTELDADIKIRIAQSPEDYSLSLECLKDGKSLKAVPSKYNKEAQVCELKEILRQLREQQSRTRQMFEEFMEYGTELPLEELQTLLKNKIAGPYLANLVFMLGNHSVYYSENGFENPKGIKFSLAPNATLRIAHPYDLYRAGDWAFYQKYIFDHQIKQPFKQVFRELYLLTDEEREMKSSMRFAGHQIKPKRTVGCLKGRRWIADYEDGLQKVYYKENIVARIYAVADWFSPGDIEYPTIESVDFFDRNTYAPIPLKDIPPIIFSEVMRDVDLAISVAHAGDVDPETSHSTIEMRKVIAEYNMQLFGLKNVSFTEKHAHIEGKRASYNIHLGSGVIFQIGGAQIAVLPVHSQHRGKLFLPFIDDDPQTSEIMTKILFFANDMKIKDPFILNQIRPGHKPC
ncbi:MAG: DUF4132 domain-containing protein [Proteobacteria bacterium]|nr:DUF4132 domain-containing protein [Pseudomonadota bacterium]